MKKKDIKKFLDKIKWPEDLKAGKVYSSECNDIPGKKAMVTFTFDGDAHMGTERSKDIHQLPGPITYCRFRTKGGGGRDFYTRQALMVLALAMELDNEER